MGVKIWYDRASSTGYPVTQGGRGGGGRRQRGEYISGSGRGRVMTYGKK